MARIVISFICGFILSLFITTIILEPADNFQYNSAVIDSLMNNQYVLEDSIGKLIQEKEKNSNVSDTIIIVKKYEYLKDGVVNLPNDSIYKLIFTRTEHLF